MISLWDRNNIRCNRLLAITITTRPYAIRYLVVLFWASVCDALERVAPTPTYCRSDLQCETTMYRYELSVPNVHGPMDHARRSMIIANMCRSSYSVNSLNNKNPNVDLMHIYLVGISDLDKSYHCRWERRIANSEYNTLYVCVICVFSCEHTVDRTRIWAKLHEQCKTR